MKWSVELFIALIRTYPFMIAHYIAEQAPFWPGQVFFGRLRACAADNPGAKGDNPGDDDLCPFHYDEMMTIKQGDDGIRGLLNTDDMVWVKIHLLFVQTGEKNHGPPLNK